MLNLETNRLRAPSHRATLKFVDLFFVLTRSFQFSFKSLGLMYYITFPVYLRFVLCLIIMRQANLMDLTVQLLLSVTTTYAPCSAPSGHDSTSVLFRHLRQQDKACGWLFIALVYTRIHCSLVRCSLV